MSKCACVHFGYSEFCAHVGVDTHVGTSTGWGGSLQHQEQNLSLGLPPASVQSYWHHHSWIYFFFFFSRKSILSGAHLHVHIPPLPRITTVLGEGVNGG